MTIEICQRSWINRPGEFGAVKGTVEPENDTVFRLNSGTVAEITGTEDGGKVVIKEGVYDTKSTVSSVTLNDGDFFRHGKWTFYGHSMDKPMPVKILHF